MKEKFTKSLNSIVLMCIILTFTGCSSETSNTFSFNTEEQMLIQLSGTWFSTPNKYLYFNEYEMIYLISDTSYTSRSYTFELDYQNRKIILNNGTYYTIERIDDNFYVNKNPEHSDLFRKLGNDNRLPVNYSELWDRWTLDELYELEKEYVQMLMEKQSIIKKVSRRPALKESGKYLYLGATVTYTDGSDSTGYFKFRIDKDGNVTVEGITFEELE